MGTLNISELRKRYYIGEDGKSYCEYTVYRNDTQCIDRSWVKQETDPASPIDTAALAAPSASGLEYDKNGT